MAQGYTQPVSGLAFLGFCSAGKRYLPQEAKLCPAWQTPANPL